MLVHNPKNRVRLNDIAARLKVSPSTVSAVIGRRYKELRIAKETVQRVLEAAREMGYVPNVTARSLRSANSRERQFVVALMTSYEAPIDLIRNCLEALRKTSESADSLYASFVVTVEMFSAGRLRDLPGLLDGKRFNGAIIANTIPDDDAFLEESLLPYPVVLIGRSVPGYSSISLNQEFIGAKSADILLKTGARRLCVLCPRVLTQGTRKRLEAFQAAALRQGSAPPEAIVCQALSESAACDAMETYLARHGQVDGVFAVTDALAVGVYHAIKQRGKRIPRDIAVVGIGDSAITAFLDPPLTGFSCEPSIFHEDGVRLLMRQLRHDLPAPVEKVFRPQPILRGSTDRGALARHPG